MSPGEISRYREIREQIFRIIFRAEFYEGDELAEQIGYAVSSLKDAAISVQKNGEDPKEAADEGEDVRRGGRCGEPLREEEILSDEDMPFAFALTEKDIGYIGLKSESITEKIGEIDAQINAAAKNWKTSRMGKTELAIIRLAAYEMKYEEDIPVSVSINEAVELAKKYCSEQGPAFVNGVLAKLV